jgi:hypothetical protein
MNTESKHDVVGVASHDLLAAPFALFDGATYYPAPGWMGHRGQYATIEAAAADGQKYADEQYGWWQVVDLRTLKIVAGEGSGHTGLFGACPANPSANVKEHAPLSARASVDHGVKVGVTEEHENRPADRGCCVSTCSASSIFRFDRRHIRELLRPEVLARVSPSTDYLHCSEPSRLRDSYS